MLTCCGQISVSVCKLCSRLLIYDLGNNFEAWVLLVCLCICIFPDSSIQLFPFQSFCWIYSIHVLVSILLPISTDMPLRSEEYANEATSLSQHCTGSLTHRPSKQQHDKQRVAECLAKRETWIIKADQNIRVGATEHTV